MVHLLKTKNEQFRWINVRKQGIGFEIVGMGSETHTQKHNCLKNLFINMSSFRGTSVDVIDHSLEDKMTYSNYVRVGSTAEYRPELKVTVEKGNMGRAELLEIEWVEKNRAIPKLINKK